MFESIKKKGFQVVTLHHAEAILKHDMGAAVRELETVLGNVSIPIEELVYGGGGEGEPTQRLRHSLAERQTVRNHRLAVWNNVRRVEELGVLDVADGAVVAVSIQYPDSESLLMYSLTHESHSVFANIPLADEARDFIFRHYRKICRLDFRCDAQRLGMIFDYIHGPRCSSGWRRKAGGTAGYSRDNSC